MSHISVRVPKNPDESLALDLIQTIWPMLGWLHDAPPRLGVVAKIAMSNTMWDSLCRLLFEPGMSPVDALAQTLFGDEVVVNNWPRERVEIVLPVPLQQHGRPM